MVAKKVGNDSTTSPTTALAPRGLETQASNDRSDEPDVGSEVELMRRFGGDLVVTKQMVKDQEALIKKDERDEHGHETEDMHRLRVKKLRLELREMKQTLFKQEVREGKGCSSCPQPLALVGGQLRKAAMRVCEHPYFDPFIMLCIVVNCVFLALADPVATEEPEYQVLAGKAFLYVFTAEFLLKLTALSELYFDDYWNWLDIVVVLEGWFSEIESGGGFLSGLKTLRILRPLRVANRLPALKKIITAMLGSLPAIFDTFVVFFFFLLIFSMLCVMLWSGTFHYRCMDDESGEWVNTDELCFPAPTAEKGTMCGYLQFMDKPYSCEVGESCKAFTETPESGSVNFDNLGYGFITLFAVSTMEGWAGVLFHTQDVMTEGTFFVFLVIIFIGNFTIVNLMIAAILVQLSGHEEKQEAEDLQERLVAAEAAEFKLLEAEEAAQAEEMAYAAQRERRIANGESQDKLAREDRQRERSKKPKRSLWAVLWWALEGLQKVFAWCCYSGFPHRPEQPEHWGMQARWWVADDASPFSNFIQCAIIFNLGILAMDSHGLEASMTTFLATCNLVLTGIFVAEMGLKLLILGVPDYTSSNWNLFDGFIVIGSILEISLESGASSLGALRVVRMLRLTRVARLARLANKWRSLQDVIKLITKSSAGIGPVLLLLVLFMFIFTILAMQMFGTHVNSDDYIRFDSFYVAYVQCFFVIIGEAWVDIMYVTMADAGPISALYFVVLIITGSFILVNLILAEVLSDSSPNSLQKEMGLKLIEATLQEYTYRCAFMKLKYNMHEGRRIDMRREAVSTWLAITAPPPPPPALPQSSAPSSSSSSSQQPTRSSMVSLKSLAEDEEVTTEEAGGGGVGGAEGNWIGGGDSGCGLVGGGGDSGDSSGVGGGDSWEQDNNGNAVEGEGEEEGRPWGPTQTPTRQDEDDNNDGGGEPSKEEAHVLSVAGVLGVPRALLEPLPAHLYHYPEEARVAALAAEKVGKGKALLAQRRKEADEKRRRLFGRAVGVALGRRRRSTVVASAELAFMEISRKASLAREEGGKGEGGGVRGAVGGGGGGGGGPPGEATTDSNNNNDEPTSPETRPKTEKKKKGAKKRVDGDSVGAAAAAGDTEGKQHHAKKHKKKKRKKKHKAKSGGKDGGDGDGEEEEEDPEDGAADFDLVTWRVTKELGLLVAQFLKTSGAVAANLIKSGGMANDEDNGSPSTATEESLALALETKVKGCAEFDHYQHAVDLVIKGAAEASKALLLSKSVLDLHVLTDKSAAPKEDASSPTSTAFRVAARASLKRGSVSPGAVVMSPPPANPEASIGASSSKRSSLKVLSDEAANNSLWSKPRRSFAMLMGKAAFQRRAANFKVGYHVGGPDKASSKNELFTFDLGGVVQRAQAQKEAKEAAAKKEKKKYLTGWAKAEADARTTIFSAAPPLPLPPDKAALVRLKSTAARSPTRGENGNATSSSSSPDNSRPSSRENETRPGSPSGSGPPGVSFEATQSRRGKKLGADDILIMKKSSRHFLAYRKTCKRIVNSKAWRDFIMVVILVSCVIMIIIDEETPFTSPWFMLDAATGLVFVAEVFLMWGYCEFDKTGRGAWVTGYRAYLHDPWNRIDLAIVFSQILGPVFKITNIGVGYSACTVVRSFRPLRIINRVETLKATVTLLFSSLMRLGTLIIFLGFSMTAYAVVGMQLLKGTYWYCDDGDFAEDDEYLATVGSFPFNAYVHGQCDGMDHPLDAGLSAEKAAKLCEGKAYTSRPCAGVFVSAVDGNTYEAQGSWRNPTFHFDDFPNSFLSVFVLSTEGWAEIVWSAFAATSVDYSGSPYYDPNLLVIFYVFFGVSFFGLYMLNLFIGVVFDQYNEMKALTNDGKPQKADDRNWEEYRRRIYAVKRPEEKKYPTAWWRKKCAWVAEHPNFSNFIVSVIALNAVTLAVTHRDQPQAMTDGLEWSNVAFAGIFVFEAFVKVVGLGGSVYFGDSENMFDFVVTSVSLVDSMLFITNTCSDSDSAFLRFVRSMRTFRLMRLVNLIPGCADIMLACKYAGPRLLNVCALLTILIFFFANVGVEVLGTNLSAHGSRYANFNSVQGAMQLLFVILTGDAWTDYMGEMIEERPDLKGLIVTFFLVYLLVQYFVIVNLFVMVVCEAFEVLSEEHRKIAEKMLPHYQEAWSKIDPHMTGFINHTDLEALLRLIPEPIGVSYPTRKYESRKYSLRRAQTKANFMRRVPGFQCSFTECLEHITFLWLVEVGEYKTSGVQTQVDLLGAAIVITRSAHAFLERKRALLAALDSVKERSDSLALANQNEEAELVRKHVPKGQSHIISIFGSAARGRSSLFGHSRKSSVGGSVKSPVGNSSRTGSMFRSSRASVVPDNSSKKQQQQQQQQVQVQQHPPSSPQHQSSFVASSFQPSLLPTEVLQTLHPIDSPLAAAAPRRYSSNSSLDGKPVLGTYPQSPSEQSQHHQQQQQQQQEQQDLPQQQQQQQPGQMQQGYSNGSNRLPTTPIKPPAGPPPHRPDAALPPGWVVSHSTRYNTHFYYHEETGTSSWIKPSTSNQQLGSGGYSPSSNGSGGRSAGAAAHSEVQLVHSGGHYSNNTAPFQSSYTEGPESDDYYDDSLL